MALIKNPHRPQGLDLGSHTPFPSVDAEGPLHLLKACPKAATTPLVNLESLAEQTDVGAVFIKDERPRMGLGSFKALGAAYVIAHHAQEACHDDDMHSALSGQTYVTASAGNHGLSVAAGAKIFGAKAIIYLSETVPKAFGARLEEKGAIVRFEGADYEASMAAAALAAQTEDLILLSDSSWEGYFELPHRLMEGYLVFAAEATNQMPHTPTHIFLQAGVGGMAAAFAAFARKTWGDEPTIVVVEPEAAPALLDSIQEGQFQKSNGPVSNMGRLDCKEPSLISLKGLARDADFFMTLSDELATSTVDKLEELGMESTPSGVAGIAALFANSHRAALGLSQTSVVFAILSEGPEK